MVSLTISYIPWIVYWTLSATGLKYGTILMFLLSLILVVYEKNNNDFSLMDKVALGYSAFAILVTYGFQSSIFIRGDGYLGYGVLFLMGVVSRKKCPFMWYYIRKDLVDKQKTIKLSIYTTNVWCAVFAMSTLIFIAIRKPVIAIVASNVLVFLAIVLSLYQLNQSDLQK